MTTKKSTKKVEEVPEVVEVNEVGSLVGIDEQHVERNDALPPVKLAGEAVLASEVPAVRTSLDEQRDPETHVRLAEESQRDLAEREALKAAQDEQYLYGDR